jgi:two-component system response regulator NreC
MNADPIKILLVDDQNIMLDGLQSLLERDSDFQVVGRANNGVQALAQTESLKPDIVLMDISMPEMDGIEATKAIKETRKTKDVKVLVLSMYALKDFVNELLEAGASGYVLKNTSREELREALLTVASGHRYLAKPVVEVLEQPNRFKPRVEGDAYHALTRREKEIIKLVVAERSNQEIADELHLSPATVETHRKNIFHKLDIRSAAGLVKYAMERGWEL